MLIEYVINSGAVIRIILIWRFIRWLKAYYDLSEYPPSHGDTPENGWSFTAENSPPDAFMARVVCCQCDVVLNGGDKGRGVLAQVVARRVDHLEFKLNAKGIRIRGMKVG